MLTSLRLRGNPACVEGKPRRLRSGAWAPCGAPCPVAWAEAAPVLAPQCPSFAVRPPSQARGRKLMADSYLIGFNGLFLDHPRTGTGVYTREVLTRLVRISEPTAPQDGPLRYVVVGHPEHAAACAAAVPYVRLQAPLRRRSQNAEKVLWEQLALPLATARLGVDLLYAPYFSLPLVSGVRTVVTVHDLIPLLLPEYAPSVGLKAYFRLVSAATRHADAVVTDSYCSAGDIARLLGVPPERIHVVCLGVDPLYSAPLPPERLQALCARLGLPERFILYMGGIDPRKNVGVLLRAQRGVRDRGHRALPLVIVAPRGRLPARWDHC